MSAQPNYSRMPGFGDLPGDSSNPNSPDYVEPAFDEWEAMRNVVDDMDADDRAVILGDLADAGGWLRWALRQDNLPKGAKAKLDLLARHAKNLEAKRDAEYRSLNGDPR